jgi:hypothetical protein
MVDATKSANTPPVDLPARKIMRRGDETKSGTNTTANSQNPSKATSEAGGSDGGNDSGNRSKDKSAMTREEREARYREARQRIFGSAQSDENELPEAATSTEEKDMSRSSSASGKRKNKKQRNFDDDDGFEARSRYNVYYPGQYAPSGYSGDGTVYFSGFSGPNPQYAPMHPNASSPLAYNSGYSTMMPQDAQSQYTWPSQQYQASNGAMMHSNYSPIQNGYDISTDFQRGMQSFQSAGMPNQMTPKMTNASMAGYQDPYAQPPPNLALNSGWSQQPTYPITQGPYGPTGPGNRPMSAPTQGPVVPEGYPYGQFPPANYNGGKPGRNQHPIPGSYQRQPFNPQSQAFVPGGRNIPFQMPPNMSGGTPQVMSGYGGLPMSVANQMPHQMQRPSPPTANTQVFGSPHVMQSNNLLITNPNSSPSSQQPLSAQGSSQQTSVPAQSSIAKYGTPSNLPARPPPTQQQASKFNLPGSVLAPATRVLSNPTSPYLGGSVQSVSIQGGSGHN